MQSSRRRDFLRTAAAAVASPVLAQQPLSRKPNIVFILADDLGAGDLGCYGQRYIRTPNIDRLAAEGMRFTRAYAGCTVCAPSRSVLMTGYHMGHTSVRSNPGGVPILDSDITIAEALKKAGYVSGGFGKWGLGDNGTPGVPWKQGFEQFFGYLNQVHAHYYYPEFLYDNDRRYLLDGNKNGKRTTYSHDVIAGKALEFVRRHRRDPFFLYVPFTIPHLELLVPEDSLAQYRGKFPEQPYIDRRKHYADQPHARAAYAGMVTRMDRDVGRILSLLAELNLDNDTVVFFASDNGAAPRLRGDDFFNSTAGLRGHKQNLYEGGIRAPMIARWPGRIARGVTNDHLWAFWDVMPTLCDLAGTDAPSGIDGISAAPQLLGRGQQRQHEYLYWELPRYDGKRGQFFDEIPMQAARMGDWKAVRPTPNGPVELYNLRDDPREERDVARDNPQVLARLNGILRTARRPPRAQSQPDPDFLKP